MAVFRLLDRGGTQSVLGLAALGVAVCVAGGLVWATGGRAWAIALFVIGGLLIAFSVIGFGVLLFHRDEESGSATTPRPAAVSAKADHQSISQAAGRDAIRE